MGKPRLTKHVKDQVRKMQKQGIVVTIAEILFAVNNFGTFPANMQTRVVVKPLPKRVTWIDDGVEKTGDLLIAMVDVRDPGDDGRIVTIMTRKQSQDLQPGHQPGPNDIVHGEA